MIIFIILVIQGNIFILSIKNILFKNLQLLVDSKICNAKLNFYNRIYLEKLH